MVGRTREEKNRHTSTVPSSMVPPATKRKIQNESKSVVENNHKGGPSSIHLTVVISRDMVHYCFDILVSHLKRLDLPKSKHPKFTNDA